MLLWCHTYIHTEMFCCQTTPEISLIAIPYQGLVLRGVKWQPRFVVKKTSSNLKLKLPIILKNSFVK